METNTALDISLAYEGATKRSTAQKITKKIDDIDNYLGSSATRFFGHGYRKVSYSLSDLIVVENEISASAAIDYPEDWSVKKKQMKLKPHMSSIDVLLLSTHLAGKMLAKNDANHKNYSLIQISITAGKKPMLELDAIRVSLRCNEKVIDGHQKTVEFEGMVGNMKVRLTVVKCDTFHNIPNNCLLDTDYIHSGFKKVDHCIKNLNINGRSAVTANFRKSTDIAPLKKVDAIDAFVSSLQLGQVMLYELDNLSRANSNNLWMRSINITRNLRPYQYERIQAQLKDLQLFKVNQKTWRSAEIVSKLADIDVICSVAHQIPTQG